MPIDDYADECSFRMALGHTHVTQLLWPLCSPDEQQRLRLKWETCVSWSVRRSFDWRPAFESDMTYYQLRAQRDSEWGMIRWLARWQRASPKNLRSLQRIYNRMPLLRPLAELVLEFA